jgi:hypothetical protein
VTARTIGYLGAAGIGFAVTGALTWALAPIAVPDTAGELARHYDENRTAMIVASVIVVGGNALLAAWYVALAAVAGERPAGRVLGQIGVVGMVIQIAALTVAFTIFAAVAYRRPDAEAAQVATDVAWLLVSLAGGPATTVAILGFAVALRGAGFGGGWLLPLSVVAAVAHLVVAVSFADDGFFSPFGGVEIVVPLIYTAWIGLVGLALLRGE